MLKFFVYCFLLTAAGSPYLNCYTAAESNLRSELGSFNQWRHTYNKTYTGEKNISHYFNNWRENRKYIEQHNAENHDFTLELNTFADLSWENRSEHADYNHRMARKRFLTPTQSDMTDEEKCTLPEAIDWRTKGVVTPVKNQGQCGSCWSFSSTGAMEGQYALKKGKLLSFSESQIVDCDTADSGCGGGLSTDAFAYVIANGIESEQSYPYVPLDEKCAYNKFKVAAQFRNYTTVTGGEIGLQKAVATVGPISVAIDASSSLFQLYKDGVFFDPSCSQTELDHAVLVVGYGTTTNGTDYWLVKNSWGATWGDNGYIKMARNHNNNCGIATQPSYPEV